MLVGALLYRYKAVRRRPSPNYLVGHSKRKRRKPGLLLDVGLNADCKPEQLNQFAVMGSVYCSSNARHRQSSCGPRNVGEEEGKRQHTGQATYPLLKENKQINFIRRTSRGRDILMR